MTSIMVAPDDPYRPGSCNIGQAEIARRRLFGALGVAVAVVLAVVLIGAGAPPPSRLLVALPLAGGFVGLLQARMRFCVSFALLGVRNFGAVGDQVRVEDPAARRADRRRAFVMLAACGLAALVAAGILVVLPV